VTADTFPCAQRFAHEALFYAGDQGFVDGVAPFVREGVARGEAVLVVVPARKIELLRDSLNGEAEWVLFADMAEVGANPARIIPAWQDFVERNDGRQMRGVGEPISSDRGREELVECQRHEQLLNVAFATSPAWRLLCPYDTEALEPAVIDEALRSHPVVLEGGRCRPSEAYLGLGATGLPLGLPLLDPPASAEPFAFDADSLVECRRRVYWQGTRAGLGVARTNDLVLAVNEILTNSVRHGGGTGVLRIWQDDGMLVCEVRDGGRIDDPLADRRRPGPDQTGGRGLWIANQLCDLVQLRSLADGSVVRVSMRRA
jgi:anti-sigma regulatory factor (Ser/Thr protein kinase)